MTICPRLPKDLLDSVRDFDPETISCYAIEMVTDDTDGDRQHRVFAFSFTCECQACLKKSGAGLMLAAVNILTSVGIDPRDVLEASILQKKQDLH